MARPGASPGGSVGVTPAWRKRDDEARRPDGVEQPDRRHVERQLQRLADADVALVAHVEILRPVAGEIGRPVLDQRLLRDEAFLEGEAVDERLQRRARRAQRPGHVDPAGAAGVEIVGRADLAEDLAGHGVGQHHGDRDARAELSRGLPRDGLEPFLHALADRQLVAALRRDGCAAPHRRHGRQARAGRGGRPKRRRARRARPPARRAGRR